MLEKMLTERSPCGGVQINTAIVQNSLNMSQKPKIKLSDNFTTSLPGISPGNSIPYHRYICIPMFTSALFIIAKNWNKPSCQSEGK